ncbi:hypothetical protein DFQ30_005748, partial [Apophysomyces sp. BC1015]
RLPEDRRARDECIAAGGGDLRDVVGLYAAIDLQVDLAAGCRRMRVDAPPHFTQFAQRLGDERLSAKPGVHRHDQHEIDAVHHVVQIVQW